MSFFENNLRFQTIVPISIVMAIILFISVIIIPQLVQANAEQRSYSTAVASLKQFKVLRAYYTENVVKKIQRKGEIKASMYHYGEADKIPLPATMIHDLSELFEKNGSKLSLYSAYPFPNRHQRQLDAFQQQAWQKLQKKPDEIVRKTNAYDGKTILRVAMSDQMQVQACVDCHNSHPSSPKTDWRIGDVRGVLEIAIDISSHLELANTLSFYIILGIVIGSIVLIVIFVLLTGRMTDQFRDISNSMIRLGKGDYSTELSQNSSSLEVNQMKKVFKLFKDTLIGRQKLEQQKQLFESEKITLLGRMVAGVAHEVNTPIGIGVTAASVLQEELESIKEKFASEKLKKIDLERFFSSCDDSAVLLTRNLNRAAELISSFKQVSVDQVSEEPREIRLWQYLKETVHSMLPKIKKSGVIVNIECLEDCQFYTYPGALSQVITNLIANSIIHGFGNEKGGHINIRAAGSATEGISIHYTDDGKGIAEELLGKVMMPFFTTQRDNGGSGLGLSIIHNIVTQKLEGKISLNSKVGQGVTFDIHFPILKPL